MAAGMLGGTIAEIAKTICFESSQDGNDDSVLVVLSGSFRVNVNKLCDHLKVPKGTLRKMSPEDVRSRTGYSIGGVPPFPHFENVRVLVDESLFQFTHVWAAAGTDSAVMKIEPSSLTGLLKMPLVDVSE